MMARVNYRVCRKNKKGSLQTLGYVYYILVTFYPGSEETLGVKASMRVPGSVETSRGNKSPSLHLQCLRQVPINFQLKRNSTKYIGEKFFSL
jgi:hypothetical protein